MVDEVNAQLPSGKALRPFYIASLLLPISFVDTYTPYFGSYYIVKIVNLNKKGVTKSKFTYYSVIRRPSSLISRELQNKRVSLLHAYTFLDLNTPKETESSM